LGELVRIGVIFKAFEDFADQLHQLMRVAFLLSQSKQAYLLASERHFSFPKRGE
jgi:hypothetical protein